MDKPHAKVIHSRCADGTPVYEKEQPARLPTKDGNFPLPDPNAGSNPHSRLRIDMINKRVYQARSFAANSVPVKDIDFTRQVNRRTGRALSYIPVPHEQAWEEVVPGRPSAGYNRSGHHKPLDES